MKIEITRNEEKEVIGYKIIRESADELEVIERIRDMYFWGHLGEMKYDGRSSEKGTDDTVELRFIGAKHRKR
jgi:hypothetical protein